MSILGGKHIKDQRCSADMDFAYSVSMDRQVVWIFHILTVRQQACNQSESKDVSVAFVLEDKKFGGIIYLSSGRRFRFNRDHPCVIVVDLHAGRDRSGSEISVIRAIRDEYFAKWVALERRRKPVYESIGTGAYALVPVLCSHPGFMPKIELQNLNHRT